MRLNLCNIVYKYDIFVQYAQSRLAQTGADRRRQAQKGADRRRQAQTLCNMLKYALVNVQNAQILTFLFVQSV